MKKLLAFALAMVCVLGLCACNSKKDIPFDDTDVFFAGKVTEVYDNYLLIEVSDMGNTSFSVGTGVEVSLESNDKTFNKSDLSAETLEWLEKYNAMSEDEQLAISYIPEDLYELCGYGEAENGEINAPTK